MTNEKKGGARSGAGRKSIGTRKHLQITMPDELWAYVDQQIAKGTFSGYSEMFRQLVRVHEMSLLTRQAATIIKARKGTQK